MPFGGYCPLPHRLIGDELEGVSAAQWQRLASDLAASERVLKIAVMTYDCAATPAVIGYSGVNGTGVGSAPTIAYVSPGIVDITWSRVYENIHGESQEIGIATARHQGHTYGGATLVNKGNVTVTAPHSIRVECFDSTGAAANGRVSVVVWGTYGAPREHEDYGGALDKHDCTTETVPYAYTFYREYTDALGSAFSEDQDGVIHALKLAKARCRGAESRTAERFRCNAMPTLSEEISGQWCGVMGVPFIAQRSNAFRRKMLASRLSSSSGPSKHAIDAAVLDLLGDRLVEVHRYVDDPLTTPPDYTYWPAGTPGTPALDIGGGAWSSARSRLFVEVEELSRNDQSEYRELLDVHLMRLLDTNLPAHATFDWGVIDSGGFILNESFLGIGAL